MKEEFCIVNGRKQYLNDLFVELPDYEEDFIFIYQGKKFKVFPKNANEFCMDYSRDNYSQQVYSINDSMEGLFNFMYTTGDIVVLIEDENETE